MNLYKDEIIDTHMHLWELNQGHYPWLEEDVGHFEPIIGNYTQISSRIGFSAAPKHRNSPILSDLIFLILGHLRSANFESFRVAQNPILELI